MSCENYTAIDAAIATLFATLNKRLINSPTSLVKRIIKIEQKFRDNRVNWLFTDGFNTNYTLLTNNNDDSSEDTYRMVSWVNETVIVFSKKETQLISTLISLAIARQNFSDDPLDLVVIVASDDVVNDRILEPIPYKVKTIQSKLKHLSNSLVMVIYARLAQDVFARDTTASYLVVSEHQVYDVYPNHVDHRLIFTATGNDGTVLLDVLVPHWCKPMFRVVSNPDPLLDNNPQIAQINKDVSFFQLGDIGYDSTSKRFSELVKLYFNTISLSKAVNSSSLTTEQISYFTNQVIYLDMCFSKLVK